jgi:hypothetical protein
MKSFDLDPSTCRRSHSRRAISFGGRKADSLPLHGLPALSIALSIALSSIGLAVSGCNSGAGANTGGQGSGNAPGSIVDQPDPTIGSLHFVVDQNSGGHATHPRLLSLKWGRLANVYDSTGTLQQRDMVVGPDIPSADPVNLTLTINPVTDETAVQIGFVYGTPGYFTAFAELDRNLTPIVDKSLDPNELPPYSVAPRNSALILQFDDLLDATTIKNETVKLLTGNPPIAPLDLRCIPDINHGDVADFTHLDPGSGQQVPGADGVLEFHTTRVILDTTVSEIEAAESNPPLPENALGLPASPTANLPNVGIRIPTVQDASIGQLVILKNPAGHGISFTNSGPNDPASLTLDVVRALRSGNNNDQNHGFLFDDIQPQIVGKQAVGVGTVIPGGNPGEYQTSVTFTVLACKSKLKVGDVIEEPGVFGQVLVETADPDANGTIAEVHFKIVYPANGAITPGVAQIASVFDQTDNFGQQACFLRFPGAASPPNLDVSTDSTVILRFSEPMDPLTVKPFDSFMLTRTATLPPTYNQIIVGAVTASADLREFTFTPTLPLTHVAAATETYYVTVTSDATGPTDLAGNPVLSSGFLPQVTFRIAATQTAQNTDGFALRFNSTDEVNNGTPDGPELRGQFLYDLTAGVLRPRSVVRFGAAATRDKPVVGAMRIPPSGVQTPLSPLGSKLQCIWRYCDVGMALTDETFYNVDVEGLDWAPIGGNVVADSYTNFAIYLSHCFKLPDESVSNTTLLPLYPSSGLVSTYSQNVLNDPADHPQSNVHPKALGYTLNPADRFLSTTTPVVTMMPYPLNRTLPVSQHAFYTWRDTTLRSVGGPNNGGAEMPIVVRVIGSGTAGQPYGPGVIPTIGLPLLMEFRCYPDTEAHGTNSFDINIAINSSSAPTFRAFSTGGTNSSGQQVVRNPDLEQVASGGFNPTSVPPGAPTLPIDNTVYIGQMDLVIRISRAHSIWFNAGSSSTIYSQPVIEPRPSDLPQGTQIVLAFRGAQNVTGDPAVNADRLDAYGELLIPPGVGVVTFFGGDSTWKTDLSVLNGAKFFQVRISFVSNVDTLLAPYLSALGFAFRH